MFKRILVPLDGSPFSEAALPHAEALAKCFDAELVLAEVVAGIEHTMFVSAPVEYEGSHYNPVWSAQQRTVSLPNRLADQASEYLQGVAAKLEAHGIRTQREVLEGPTAESLLKHIESINADVVVMSTHGRGGIQRTLLGSVADRVSRHTHVPVLLVRPGV